VTGTVDRAVDRAVDRDVERAVIVGSGSAGRRHLTTLRRLLPDAELVMVRRPDSTTPLDVPTEQGAMLVESLGDALDMGPTDLGVVASPAPFHVGHTAAFVDAGVPAVLLEKPVATSAAGAEPFVGLAARDTRIVVGYHLRWSDTAPAMRALLADDVVGRVTSFGFHSAQHLSGWRPWARTEHTVSGRADLGGGILLEISHELDGLRWLLAERHGEVDAVAATLAFDGAPTDGAVDTVADLDLTLADGTTGTVHLDMVTPIHDRRWWVVGELGELHADLLTGRIERRAPDGSVEVLVERSADDERDRAELRLVEHTLAVRTGTAAPGCTVEDGLQVLRIVDAARRSHKDGGRPVATGAADGRG
jgi:predicted dehydrogenase